MKKFIIILTALLIVLCSCNTQKNEQKPNKDEATETIFVESEANMTEEKIDIPSKTTYNHKSIKAVWLSQFDLEKVYTSNASQRAEVEFKAYIDRILKNLSDMGFNTVILQIRPYCDSFYPSDIFPPSRYAVGSYSNSFSYDPLPYIIQQSHSMGMSIQAWINPLRCMTESEIEKIDNGFQIKKWYDSAETNGKYVVSFNNRLYLNPAYENVRDYIVSGVNEILSEYEFDGIHMDDYFYPTTERSFDESAYNEFISSNPDVSLRQFRYNALNALVSDIYSEVKANNKDKLFGISPAGNISNVTDNSFADVYTWCSAEGYIDYICPQIYFGLEHQTLPFDKTLDKWSNIIKTDSVKLVVGLTLGKAFSKEDKWAGSGKNEWYENSDVIKRCIEYSSGNEKCIGVSLFSYQYFFDPLTNLPPESTKLEIKNMLPAMNNIYFD